MSSVSRSCCHDGGQHLTHIEAQVVRRSDPVHGPSAATVLAEPLIAITAVGAVVVPAWA